jgi:hypothetical protein
MHLVISNKYMKIPLEIFFYKIFKHNIFYALLIHSFSTKKMATSYLLDHRRFWANAKPLKRRILEGSEVIQQSDYLKDFLLLIQSDGLEAAYDVYGDDEPRPPPPESSYLKAPEDVTYDYDVIVVGAGMAGLSAAYELKKAGLSVIILEQTERYGGRVFTYGLESNLAPGLYGEGKVYVVNSSHGCSDEKNNSYFKLNTTCCAFFNFLGAIFGIFRF